MPSTTGRRHGIHAARWRVLCISVLTDIHGPTSQFRTPVAGTKATHGRVRNPQFNTTSLLRQDFVAAIEDVNAHRKQPAEACEESPHSKSKAFVFGATFNEREQAFEEKIINDTRTVIISTVTRTEDHDGVYNNAVLLEARLKAPKYQLSHKLAVPGASFPIQDSDEGYTWQPAEGYDRSYGSTQEGTKMPTSMQPLGYSTKQQNTMSHLPTGKSLAKQPRMNTSPMDP